MWEGLELIVRFMLLPPAEGEAFAYAREAADAPRSRRVLSVRLLRWIVALGAGALVGAGGAHLEWGAPTVLAALAACAGVRLFTWPLQFVVENKVLKEVYKSPALPSGVAHDSPAAVPVLESTESV